MFSGRILSDIPQHLFARGVVLKKEVWERSSHSFPTHYTPDLG